MRNLLATTAIAAMMSLPAAAQQSSDSTQTDQTASNSQSGQQQASNDPQLQNRGMTINASDLIQHSVHVRSEGSGAQEQLPEEMADAPDSWEDAGEIEDIIMTRDGQPKSVVLNAGEFLGMSDKQIETSFEDLRLVRDSDDEGEFFIVYTGDRSKLEQSEDYDTAAREERGDMSYNEQSGSMDTAQAAGGAAAGAAATQSQSDNSTETAQNDSSMQSDEESGQQAQSDIRRPTETAQSDSGSMQTDEEGTEQAQSDTGDTEMETADSEEGVVLNEGEDTQQAESEMSDDQTETAQTGDTETGTLITQGEATEQAQADSEEQMQSEESQMAETEEMDATATEDGTTYLAQTDRDALTAEDMEGLSVYGTGGEDIGEISELLIADSGKINNVVIDVGGFLGIGEKRVSVPFDELKLSRGDGGMMNELRVDVDYSEEELENMQSWED